MFFKGSNSTGNKLSIDVFVTFSSKFGKNISKEKLKILTWLEYRRQESGEEYTNTSLLKISKRFKIKKTTAWYRLKSLEESGCIQKEAKFSRSGGTHLMLTQSVIEIFKELEIKKNNALHLPGGKFINQEMLAELNAQTGWNVKMTRKLARYLNSAYLKKFKTPEAWRIYLKNKLINTAKISCKLGFIFYLLNFSTIDSVLGQVLENHTAQVQRGISHKIFDEINPLMKIDENRLLKASNLAFAEEIRKNSNNGKIRYARIETIAKRCNLSISKACELCGIRYEKDRDSAENAVKRDFEERYGREQAVSWISKVRIEKFLGMLVVEFPHEFSRDYIQTNFREWCSALEKRYWSVKWIIKPPNQYEPPG